MTKIQSFVDLNAWKSSHELALATYDLTKSFPAEEKFGMFSQMRRSAISVPSNIAEGFNRLSNKEKIQFYSIAMGSIGELQAQVMLAGDLGYASKEQVKNLRERIETSRKLIAGLTRSVRS